MSRVCDEFHKNPNINPRTQRIISPKGQVYKNLLRECFTPKRLKSVETVILNDENKNELLVLFFSDKSYLSNLYPCMFTINGITFTSTKQYFHYMKAFMFNDRQAMNAILCAQDPLKQKRIGRGIKNFDEIKWLSFAYDVLKRGHLAKFMDNKELKKKLLSIPNARFVDASTDDRIWGIGLNADHPDVSKPSKWPGNNLMGNVITEVRDIIKELSIQESLLPSPRQSRLRSRLPSPRQSRLPSPRQCRSPRQSLLPSAICDEFLRNPNINPLTNRRISPQGRIYKILVGKCSSKIRKSPKIRKQSPHPDWRCKICANTPSKPSSMRVMKPSNNVRRSPNLSPMPQRLRYKKSEETPSEDPEGCCLS
jgi:ribA/ribD-fused uncharacterized protein